MKRLKKFFVLLFLINSINILSDDSEYFKYINNLYRNKNFSQAKVETEKYLKKFPSTKHYKDMMDKLGKLYFLDKNYEKAIEVFKKLYLNENKSSLKNEYAFYLARAYASKGEKDSYTFYLNNITNKKIFEKTQYEVARDLLTAEYNKEAIEIFKNIINNNSSTYNESLLNLGIAYYNNKEYEKSFKLLNEYTSKNSDKDSIMITYLKASSLYKSNKIDEAIRYFNKIIANTNSNENYHKKSILTLVEIYANRGNELKVKELLEKISGTEEYNTAMVMLGDLYITKENYHLAIQTYQKSDDLKNPKLIYGYAYALYKLGRYEEALQKFESLKETDYYNQAIYHIFAINYKLKNYKKIIENRDIIRKVVVTQTDTDNIIRIIANSAYQLGDYKLAKDYYGRLFAISGKKENLFRVILLDTQILDIEDLENRFSQYKKLFFDDEEFKKDVYLYTGDAHYKVGNYERAEQIYKDFLNDYYNFEILSSLISTLLEQKKYEEMESYLTQTKDVYEFNYLKGIASIGLGKYSEAEEYFQKVLNLNSKDEILNDKLQLNRVRNFFLWSKYDEAISTGEAYLSNSNLSTEIKSNIYSEFLDKIGLSYFRLGKYDEARKYYKKIQDLNGYEIYGKYQIADSYFNQKDFNTAAIKYKEIFENYSDTFYAEQAHYKYIVILAQQKENTAFENEKNNFISTYPNSKLRENLVNLSANYYIETNNTEKAVDALKNLNETSENTDSQDSNNLRIINLKLKNKEYKDIEEYIAKLSDNNEQNYYFSKYYYAKNDIKSSLKYYEKLLNSTKYKNYAYKNLADYWYSQKDYKLAKKYYIELAKIKAEQQEYIFYRLANIYEKEKNYKEALLNYKKVYEKYNGKYKIDSMLKAADIYDKQENISEAKKLFFSLYKIKNNKEIREYTLEKLIYYRLVENNTVEAKKYYNELKKLNIKKAEKFEDYF